MQIDACVSGRSVSLLIMCPWFNSFIGVNVRSACIYTYFLRPRKLTVRSYILIPHPDMRNNTPRARAHTHSHILPALFAGVHIRKNHFSWCWLTGLVYTQGKNGLNISSCWLVVLSGCGLYPGQDWVKSIYLCCLVVASTLGKNGLNIYISSC